MVRNKTGNIEFRLSDDYDEYLFGEIQSITYDALARIFKIKVYYEGEEFDLPFIARYFKDAEVEFLDEVVGVGEEIKFIPKTTKDLELEGWAKNPKGTYVKSTSQYKIGKKKMEYLGRIITGTVILDENSNVLLMSNGYRFTPDMVKFVYQLSLPKTASSFPASLDGVEIKRTEDGHVHIGGVRLTTDSAVKLGRWLLEL